MDYYSKPVTGCVDCPLFSEGVFCGHPDMKVSNVYDLEWSYSSDTDTPKECPLRKLPLLLTLKP